jgi:hypothetical protein
MASKIIQPGTRVLITSDRPRYNGRTGVVTDVSVTYTVALDDILDGPEAPVLEVRAKSAQVRVA